MKKQFQDCSKKVNKKENIEKLQQKFLNKNMSHIQKLN